MHLLSWYQVILYLHLGSTCLYSFPSKPIETLVALTSIWQLLTVPGESGLQIGSSFRLVHLKDATYYQLFLFLCWTHLQLQVTNIILLLNSQKKMPKVGQSYQGCPLIYGRQMNEQCSFWQCCRLQMLGVGQEVMLW